MTSSPGSVLSFINFNILDPDINFSDHFPLLVSVRYDIPLIDLLAVPIFLATLTVLSIGNRHDLYRLRWDKADLASYYGCSSMSELVLNTCDDAIASCTNRRYSYVDCQLMVDSIYNDIVTLLTNAATCMPTRTFISSGGVKS